MPASDHYDYGQNINGKNHGLVAFSRLSPELDQANLRQPCSVQHRLHVYRSPNEARSQTDTRKPCALLVRKNFGQSMCAMSIDWLVRLSVTGVNSSAPRSVMYQYKTLYYDSTVLARIKTSWTKDWYLKPTLKSSNNSSGVNVLSTDTCRVTVTGIPLYV